MVENLNFANALGFLHIGINVGRKAWDGDFIAIQHPDEESKMTKPYIYRDSNEGELSIRAPYTLTSEDLLATDWMRV